MTRQSCNQPRRSQRSGRFPTLARGGPLHWQGSARAGRRVALLSHTLRREKRGRAYERWDLVECLEGEVQLDDEGMVDHLRKNL